MFPGAPKADGEKKEGFMIDFSKIVEDVLKQVKPDRPNCKRCGGAMHVIGWNSGREVYACSSVKSINDPKDMRPFDPGHYTDSIVEVPFGVDLDKLRKVMAEAFGKIEADAERRVREELKTVKHLRKKEEEGKKELLLDEKKPE